MKNARADALTRLAASLSIPDGEVCYITVAGRRLLIHLSETLPYHESVGACSVETTIEPIDDW